MASVQGKTKANLKAKPIPDGMHTVTPHLVCAGAADAIEFYRRAFDAVEVMRLRLAPSRPVQRSSCPLRTRSGAIAMAYCKTHLVTAGRLQPTCAT